MPMLAAPDSPPEFSFHPFTHGKTGRLRISLLDLDLCHASVRIRLLQSSTSKASQDGNGIDRNFVFMDKQSN